MNGIGKKERPILLFHIDLQISMRVPSNATERHSCVHWPYIECMRCDRSWCCTFFLLTFAGILSKDEVWVLTRENHTYQPEYQVSESIHIFFLFLDSKNEITSESDRKVADIEEPYTRSSRVKDTTKNWNTEIQRMWCVVCEEHLKWTLCIEILSWHIWSMLFSLDITSKERNKGRRNKKKNSENEQTYGTDWRHMATAGNELREEVSEQNEDIYYDLSILADFTSPSTLL